MTATCTLCRRTFAGGPADSLVLDAQGQDAAARFSQRLANHLMIDHGQIAAEIEMATLNYRGYLIFGYYETTEPGIVAGREQTRQWLHCTSRRLNVSDDELKARAAALIDELRTAGIDPSDDDATLIERHLRELRNALVEQYRHPVLTSPARA